ncbi:MAG: small multi-drug export protein [Candidatus Omnitrophica bacterium]|nr:small multi-drug export protein [Candidatus Omnitrophota bacterium]
MSEELLVLLTAAAPISELRGAIPLGIIKFGLPIYKTLFISLIGNMLPVIPILILVQPFAEMLRKFAFFKRFFDWFFERTKRKAELVQRYEALGLILFVAIPLPVTGAWTGAVAATLFKIRFRYALIAIFAGVLIACVIVTTLTIGSYNFFIK